MNDNGVRRVESGYQTDVLAKKAESFIRTSARASGPFFLWMTPTAPHDPPVPALRDVNAFRTAPVGHPPSFDEADVSDKPSFVRRLPRLGAQGRDKIDKHYRARLNTLLAVDRAVAGIVRTLQATG
jgi:hypothetical protein